MVCPVIDQYNNIEAMTLVRLYPGMYITLKQRQFHTTEQALVKNLSVFDGNETSW